MRVAVGVAFALLLALGYRAGSAIDRDLSRPLSVRTASYVGSNQCRRCHQAQHESWHRTYHRTMTQQADAHSVLGRFDGRVVEYRGVEARMTTTAAGTYRMQFQRGTERWQAEVARTVGSHRYQQYLARHDAGRGEVFYRLPVAWDVAEARFIHMNGAFLTPDPEGSEDAPVSRADYERHLTRWNDNCVYCHNVAPRPGLDPVTGVFDTHVAELGIACEACHGPGSAHVRANADPLRRYALHLGSGRDPSIANPARLPQARAVEVCGRCHGQRLADDIAAVHVHGDDFVPGDRLWDYSRPLTRSTPLNGRGDAFAPRFWPDGTPRLTAYEYQGLLQSACFQRGELTCESCHAMHAGDPAGQLRPGREGDAACTACHQTLSDEGALARHSGHDPAGPGARCRGCHMPEIVYGLAGMRISHRIELPDVAAAARTGRPDACTLCHADRSRAWALAHQGTSEHAGVAAGGDALPEALRLLLAGDPIERAAAAHALGAPESPAAIAPRAGLLLDSMLQDDYPAVRAIAWRSLRRLWRGRPPPPEAFTATDTRAKRGQAIARIRAQLPIPVAAPDPALTGWLRPQAAEVAIHIGE